MSGESKRRKSVAFTILVFGKVVVIQGVLRYYTAEGITMAATNSTKHMIPITVTEQ